MGHRLPQPCIVSTYKSVQSDKIEETLRSSEKNAKPPLILSKLGVKFPVDIPGETSKLDLQDEVLLSSKPLCGQPPDLLSCLLELGLLKHL